MWHDPRKDNNANFGFVSDGRSGMQINIEAPSRERMVSTEDVNFEIGISPHDGTI